MSDAKNETTTTTTTAAEEVTTTTTTTTTEMKPEAQEDTTLANPLVAEKYKAAADAANAAITLAVEKIQDGVKVVDVCIAADQLIEQRTASVFAKQKKMQRGVAFPTCISINNAVGHFSPLSKDTTVFKAGDIVKIDLGAHVDGYIALAAHTIVVPSMIPVTGRNADILLAVHHAAEAVQRMIKPGVKNTEITSVVSKIAAAYNVQPVLGVLSHYMQRFVIDGDKVIANRSDADHKVEEFTIEPNQVFAIDLVFSTGDGKPKELDQGLTTVYKRNTNAKYSLKVQASRALFSQVQAKAPTFPFNLRSFDEAKAKFAIKECRQHDLVQPYPVLFEKEGVVVAQAKFTVLVHENKTVKVAGRPAVAPALKLTSELQIEDENVRKLLGLPTSAKKRAKQQAAAGTATGTAAPTDNAVAAE